MTPPIITTLPSTSQGTGASSRVVGASVLGPRALPDAELVVHGNPAHERAIVACGCTHLYGAHPEGGACRYCVCQEFRTKRVAFVAGRSRAMTATHVPILTDARVHALAATYAREELVAMLRMKVLDYIPVQIGTGPFDLDPAQVGECVLCDNTLIAREVDGNISAFGFGAWARGERRWIVFHTRCVREVETGARS